MCTTRMRQRLSGLRDRVARIPFALTAIARAVRNSQAAEDFVRGLKRIPVMGRIVSSSFSSSRDSKDEKKEENAITRQALQTNKIYYIVPVASSMLLQYAASSLESPTVDTGLQYASIICLSYFMLRRLLDNTLYTLNTNKAHADGIVRRKALAQFNVWSDDLAKVLAKQFAAAERQHDFQIELSSRLKTELGQHFRDADLFRQIKKNYKTIDGNVKKNVFISVLMNPKLSLCDSPEFAYALAKIIVRIMLSRLVPKFSTAENKYDAELETLCQKYKDKLKEGRAGIGALPNQILSVFKKIESKEIKQDQCPDFKRSSSPSMFKITLENLLILVPISYVLKNYVPLGHLLSFVMTSEFYGRNILDIEKLKGYCDNHRKSRLANLKMLSFSYGLPFAIVGATVSHFFLRDALLSMGLILATRAELEDDKPLPQRSNGFDHFKPARVLAEIFYFTGRRIVPIIENALRDPESREKLMQKIFRILGSKEMDCVTAFLLGDTKKHIAPVLDGNLVVKAEAAHVLMNEVESVRDFLRLHGDKISDVVKYLKQARSLPDPVIYAAVPLVYAARPVLRWWLPNIIVTSFLFLMNLLKKEEVDKIFQTLLAKIERETFLELDIDEAESSLTSEVTVIDNYEVKESAAVGKAAGEIKEVKDVKEVKQESASSTSAASAASASEPTASVLSVSMFKRENSQPDSPALTAEKKQPASTTMHLHLIEEYDPTVAIDSKHSFSSDGRVLKVNMSDPAQEEEQTKSAADYRASLLKASDSNPESSHKVTAALHRRGRRR